MRCIICLSCVRWRIFWIFLDPDTEEYCAKKTERERKEYCAKKTERERKEYCAKKTERERKEVPRKQCCHSACQ